MALVNVPSANDSRVGGIPSDLGAILECVNVGICVRGVLEGESRMSSGMYWFDYMYMLLEGLEMVVCSDLGTLRQFLL